MAVQFGNSPLNEFSIVLHFDPSLQSLRNEHVGLLWARIRDDFPAVKQIPPTFGYSDSVKRLDDEIFPMPRFRFVSKNEEINDLELQRDSFALTWNRKDSMMPHFGEKILPAFLKYFRIFEEFAHMDLDIRDVSIDACELNCEYIVKPGEYWRSSGDTAMVVPSFKMPETGRETDSLKWFACNYVYSHENDLQLRVTIHQSEIEDESEAPNLVLDIAARTEPGKKYGESEASAWIRRANDAISTCFAKVTSEKIQHALWKPLEKET